MKIYVTMKTPDALYYAVNEAVRASIDDYVPTDESYIQDKVEEYLDIADKWFRYQETITVAIDTKDKTCVVVGRY